MLESFKIMVNIIFYAKKSSKFFSKNGVIFAFLLVSTVQLAKIDSDNVIVCYEQIGDSKITKKQLVLWGREDKSRTLNKPGQKFILCETKILLLKETGQVENAKDMYSKDYASKCSNSKLRGVKQNFIIELFSKNAKFSPFLVK